VLVYFYFDVDGMSEINDLIRHVIDDIFTYEQTVIIHRVNVHTKSFDAL
jgi:hypothetical protein